VAFFRGTGPIRGRAGTRKIPPPRRCPSPAHGVNGWCTPNNRPLGRPPARPRRCGKGSPLFDTPVRSAKSPPEADVICGLPCMRHGQPALAEIHPERWAYRPPTYSVAQSTAWDPSGAANLRVSPVGRRAQFGQEAIFPGHSQMSTGRMACACQAYLMACVLLHLPEGVDWFSAFPLSPFPPRRPVQLRRIVRRAARGLFRVWPDVLPRRR